MTGSARVACGLVAALLVAACGAQPTQNGSTANASAPAKPVDHAAMGHGQPAGETEAARALNTSMARMHRDMGTASADPDESFARMMLAHHQGAIEMARIELKHGRDPELRRLAEQVVASQEPEVQQLRRWLEARSR